jgi:hypothetical protein
MLTATLRRTTILLLLMAFLAAPWASAAGIRSESPNPERVVELTSWDFLDGVWSFLQSVLSKSGCSANPDGLCTSDTTQPPPQAKTGCHIDPTGQCVP